MHPARSGDLLAAAGRLAFVPGNIAGWRRSPHFGERSLGGWVKMWRVMIRRRRQLGHDLVKQGGAWIYGLFLSPLASPVGMLSEACLADHLGRLAAYYAGNGVIQQQAAARAVVINEVAEPFCGFDHEGPLRAGAGALGAPSHHYNPQGEKIINNVSRTIKA